MFSVFKSVLGGLSGKTSVKDAGHLGAQSWQYPFWIAHRGAGKLAPENTLAAFRLGAHFGYRMFECDAKLSGDNVLFLMHDSELERTTNGKGAANTWNWHDLSRLDAGDWHSRTYAGEPLPTLENILRFCISNSYYLNIEIKPTPNAQAQTGQAVANEVARVWPCERPLPLLTSFRVESLQAAKAAQPHIPRGLLLDTLWDGYLEMAQNLGCCAIICNHTLWDEATVAAVKSLHMRCLSYTVNTLDDAQRLIALQTDGIITDRVDLFTPSTY